MSLSGNLSRSFWTISEGSGCGTRQRTVSFGGPPPILKVLFGVVVVIADGEGSRSTGETCGCFAVEVVSKTYDSVKGWWW